jgi:hypothetical protein
MPKKYTKRANKKYAKKKRSYAKRNTNVTINKGISPISPRFVTKLKMNQQTTHSVLAGVSQDIVWNLNSLWSPSVTVASHQPYGFDTIATLYQRYRVDKVDILVTVHPNSGYNGTISLVKNNTNTGLNSLDYGYVKEITRSYSKTIRLGDVTTLKQSINLRNITGVTSMKYKSDDVYQSLVTSSPSEVLCLHVVHQPLNSVSITVNYQFIFHCEFWDSVQMSQS